MALPLIQSSPVTASPERLPPRTERPRGGSGLVSGTPMLFRKIGTGNASASAA